MVGFIATLTARDREILRHSWDIVSRDLQGIAVSIFEMIFELAPDAKLLFEFVMKDPHHHYGERGEKPPSELAFHALRFIQVIESVVQNLENTDALAILFDNVGNIHARHQEQLGFKSHYWNVFKECTLFHFRRAMAAAVEGRGRRSGNSASSYFFLARRRVSRFRAELRKHLSFARCDDDEGEDAAAGAEKNRRREASADTLRLDDNEMLNHADIDCAIILWREVLGVMIERMNRALEARGAIRRQNRTTIEHDSDVAEAEGAAGQHHHHDTKHSIHHAYFKHEMSIIVPDVFMRQGSKEEVERRPVSTSMADHDGSSN